MQRQDSIELLKTAAIDPESLSDQELIFLLRESRGRAEEEFLFAEFHRRFHPRVEKWCYRVCRDRSRALDLAQEVFLRAWRHLERFRGDASPTTWLYVIAKNHCLSAAQRLLCDPLASTSPLPDRLWDTQLPHPDASIEQEQTARDIRRLMGAVLNPLEARVMTLHYGYEVSLGCITSRMALTNPSGAKAYIMNGRRKIKGELTRRGALTLSSFRPQAA